MLLPVLGSQAGESSAVNQSLVEALRRSVRGAIRLNKHDRLLYSTDASIYQVEPLGIIEPADEADVAAAVKVCDEHRVAILPRGGGTSLAGQCTNTAMVIDLSPRMRGVLAVDVEQRTASVEAGVTVDQLNRHLTAMGAKLFFAPDPATASHATIGGCIGNNAAGTRSIKYGRTSENILGIHCVLVDGTTIDLGPGAGRRSERAATLAREVATIVRDQADGIASRFPKTIRRNAGYGLDLILRQLQQGIADEDLDLTGLICGSEGTLAVVASALVKLHPLPKCRGLALATFASVDDAVRIVPEINATGATAVELLDDVVLTAAAGNPECREYLKLVPTCRDGTNPRAILMIEYEGIESVDDLNRQCDSLQQTLGEIVSVARYVQPAELAKLWALRKACEPLLHSIGGGPKGLSKPHTFVEDNAVPVERLGEFVTGFKQIVQRHGTEAAYYAHASVGVLHVRPLIDLHDPADRERMQQIAVDVADLAKACGGVMSGEHGDGRVRGPLLERFFGPELMRAFAQIKAVFDPKGLLNPGNIVGAGAVKTITEQLRHDRERLSDAIDQVETYFDYTDQHGFRGAVEMCNGAGVCRKTAGGVMCPSYRATLDERHATRGRGNALRLAISGQLSSAAEPAWDDDETKQTLHLCLQCKACKSECPSNVDIARLKAEYTAQRYRREGTPLAAKAMGHVRTLNRLAAIAPGIANAVARWKPVRALVNKMLHLSPKRSLPPFARAFRAWFEDREQRPTNRPRVVMYEDCFHGYNEPHIAQAATQLLERLGYQVVLPRVGCCGRAMISTGLVGEAVRSAEATINVLAPYLDDPTVQAFVFLEPSCLSAIKDDWLQLRMNAPLSLRKKLAEQSMLVEEFVDRDWASHPQRPAVSRGDKPIIYHGHCHQKAVWGQDAAVRALRRVGDVTVLDSGCCGMAGSFGFTADRYDLSMQIGELSVFPPVRQNPDAVIVAPGTSCRHQIADGTHRHALHPVEVLCHAIA